MRARAFAVVCLFASGAACSAVLGIDERTLRPEDAGLADGDLPSADASQPDGGGDANVEDTMMPPVDGGPAFAVFSGSAVDFGLAGCGGGAPANRSLNLTNTGGAPLTWSASLATTPTFAIVGSTAGTIPAGGFATIGISAQGVPSFAFPGATEQATLTITTSDTLHPSTDFLLKETAAGVSLTLDPATTAFGQVPLGNQASDIPIALKNTGNLAVSLAFGAPSDPQFAIASDAGALLAPGASVTGLLGRFLPTVTTPSSADLAIMASGAPMCGISPTNLHMTGQGTNSIFSIQPGSLDFGLVNCGGAAASAKLVIVSTTGAAFSISATLAKAGASPYTFGIVPAGPATSFTVTVTPKAIVSPSPVTPDFFADTLTITAPDGPHPIDLHETAQGAILTSSTTSVAFGGVAAGTTATSPFTVKNDGNASATVSFTNTNAAYTVTPQGQVIGGAGDTSTITVSFSPIAPISYPGAATLTVPGGTVLCGPLPADISLSGTGTSAMTFVSVTPSSLDFGLVNCGATAAAQAVTIQNTAPPAGMSFNWTATLGKGAGSPYTLGQASGTVNANAMFALSVTPKAVPQTSPVTPDFYSDSLTIHTTDAGDSDHIVSLHETAQGVILAFNPTAINFGNVAVGSSTPDAAGTYQVVNSGNVPASFTLTSGDNAQFTRAAGVTGGTVNGGSSFTTFVTFKPHAPTGAKATNMSLSPSAPAPVNCGAAFPLLLPLSGTAI